MARVLGEQSVDHPNGDRDIVLVAFSGILNTCVLLTQGKIKRHTEELHCPDIQCHESSCVNTAKARVGHLWCIQGLGRF